MSKPLAECRVTVVGLGLMGASLCLDLTRRGLCREVRGVARRTDTVLQAFFSGAVDMATNDVETGVLGADIVILATPVRTIVQTLAEIGPRLWPGTLVMDMGSTKADIVRAMELLPEGVQPVGGHPMCGKETAGFEAAQENLYVNAPWVLTPPARTAPAALELAAELARAVGARPVVLDPAQHDEIVAAVSHLPFLVASALTNTVADAAAVKPAVWGLAAGGFRDTTRVAASDTRMFLDILLTNRRAVLAQVERLRGHLDDLYTRLKAGDEAGLCETLSRSREERSRWKQT